MTVAVNQIQPTKPPRAPACPVCNAPTTLAWSRTASQIRKELNDLIHPLPDASLINRDYAMYHCGNCTLEFAEPLIPGDAAFYDWLASCPWYYPATRWEFAATAELLSQHNARTILEIGCGQGSFLAHMKIHPSMRVIGLDLSPEAVSRCRAMGADAYCCDVHDYPEQLQPQIGRVDAVVAFHCLEHLADPVAFILALWKLVAPAGTIYVSTPYSPLHYETRNLEPLNRPPHHMTRWNSRSYAALAQAVGLKHRVFLPPAKSAFGRAANALAKADRPVHQRLGRRATLQHALTHPITASAEFFQQLRREKIHGKPAADVILVEFTAASFAPEPTAP